MTPSSMAPMEGWLERAATPLIAILQRTDVLPRTPARLRVAVALARGWPERLAEDGPEIVPPLLEAWGRERTKGAAARALATLHGQATINALCRWWMETGEAGDGLGQLLREAGHAPSDPVERALFWILSGQTRHDEELDPDGSLLAQAQATADAPVRQRLATATVAAGQAGWPLAMRQGKLLNTFTADDWATTVQGLLQAGDVEALWPWALQVPPVHSQTLLRAIPEGAPPPPRLGEAAGALLAMAKTLPPVEAGRGQFPWSGRRWPPGHTKCIRSLAWSPDGRWLASGGDDTTIRLWDGESGVCIHTLSGHTDGVQALAWSPDGRCLASSSYGTIRLWDPASGAPTRLLKGQFSWVKSLAWSPDGRQLASIDCDEKVQLWHLRGGVCLSTRKLKGHTVKGRLATLNPHSLSVTWSRDGGCLAAGISNKNSFSDGRDICIWDAASGTCLHILQGDDKSAAYHIGWSPDGRWLASKDQDGTTRFWDPLSGVCTQMHRESDLIPCWPDSHQPCDLSFNVRAFSPDARCQAGRGGDAYNQIYVSKCGFELLISLPFSCYERHHWSLLADCGATPSGQSDWARPWLEFITAAGSMLRRFDVAVEEVDPREAPSPYAVTIEG